MSFGPYIHVTRQHAGRFWQARTGDGPIARALWTLLAILLAIPIAILMLAFVLILVGTAIALVLIGWLRRSLFGGPRPATDPSDARDSGRENVRVIRRE
jgi:hypothetical protein